MQGRKDSFFSLVLESSMNTTCRVMTYEELLMYQKFIDAQDDIQRDKMEGLFVEKKSMEKHFSKRLLNVASEGGNSESIIAIIKEMDKFNDNYEARLNKILKIREHLEEEDDKTRDKLLNHTDHCHQKLREENNAIEKRLIQDNIEKKFSKSNL